MLELMAEASVLLDESMFSEDLLQRVAALMIPLLADDCIVDVISESKRLVDHASAHHDSARRKLFDELRTRFPARNYPGHPVRQVVDSGKSQLLRQVELTQFGKALGGEALALLRRIDPKSLMIVPLNARGRTLGAITLVSSASGYRYTESDLTVAEGLGRRMALAIDNSRLFQQTVQAVRDRDNFLAILGHELRNPLGAIANALVILNHVDAPERNRWQTVIGRQTRQLSKLVDDLLDAARISSGKIRLDQLPVDLRTTIQNCVESFEADANAKRMHIVINSPDAPVVVSGDVIRLQQIIGNLLSNALKYADSGRSVEITTAASGGEAVVSIKDTGRGIAPEMLDRIFEPFAQLDASASEARSGLGLGLAVARQLAIRHGGNLVAASQGPGHGSRFELRLPLERYSAGADEQLDTRIGAIDGRATPRTIVIVEDNQDCRETMSEWLQVNGHRVEEAVDGNTGVEKILASRPDIALIDIGLPIVDGYEVARRIRAELHSHSPMLVAITGYGQPEDHDRAIEAGFDTHLVKPVDLEALSKVIAQEPRDRRS